MHELVSVEMCCSSPMHWSRSWYRESDVEYNVVLVRLHFCENIYYTNCMNAND